MVIRRRNNHEKITVTKTSYHLLRAYTCARSFHALPRSLLVRTLPGRSNYCSSFQRRKLKHGNSKQQPPANKGNSQDPNPTGQGTPVTRGSRRPRKIKRVLLPGTRERSISRDQYQGEEHDAGSRPELSHRPGGRQL